MPTADLVLRLEAANYNPGTWTWTDTSGLNNHATQGTFTGQGGNAAGSPPTLVAGQTEGGSSVVRFVGNDYLDLASTILPTSDADGFTAFTFLRPVDNGEWGQIVAGLHGGFAYNVNRTNEQGVDRAFQAGLGTSDTSMSSTEFSNTNVRGNDSGGVFRLGGADDGTITGSSFSAGIFRVGAALNGSEPFVGDIAEIRIYNTQLTLPEIQAVEAELNGAYAIPEPSTFLLAALGLLSLLGFTRRRRK